MSFFDLEKHSLSEPFLEAVPQCLVLLCISYISGIPQSDGRFTDCQISNCGIAILQFDKTRADANNNFQFMATFLLSLFSCCFGMTRFLKNGPMTLVPRTKYGASFFAIFPTVIATIFGKGAILGCLVAFSDLSEDRTLIAWSFPIWFGLCLLPHFVYVSTINLRYFLLEKPNQFQDLYSQPFSRRLLKGNNKFGARFSKPFLIKMGCFDLF